MAGIHASAGEEAGTVCRARRGSATASSSTTGATVVAREAPEVVDASGDVAQGPNDSGADLSAPRKPNSPGALWKKVKALSIVTTWKPKAGSDQGNPEDDAKHELLPTMKKTFSHDSSPGSQPASESPSPLLGPRATLAHVNDAQHIAHHTAHRESRRTSNTIKMNDDSDDDEKANDSDSTASMDDNQLNRIHMRLEGLESFSTLGALFTGFLVQLLSSVIMSDPIDGYSPMMFLVIAFSSFGTLAALYATIVFALCSLYGKTSLGLNNDPGYLSFMTNTAVYRENAFLSLLASLMSMCATLLALLTLRCPLITSLIINGGVVAFCWLAFKHVRIIMDAAKVYVYS